MKIISTRNIYVIGDLHIGNQNYRGDLLKGTLDKIEPEAEIIGAGDYCEFINKKSFDYDSQTMPPEKQFKEFRRLFKPFAERGQLITMLKGNHEDRYFKKLDMLEMWCEQYEIPYFGRHFVFNKGDITIYAHHPQSSATTTAGRSTVFRKMRDVQEADIYLTGHFHSLFQESSYRYNRDRILTEKFFACTGSYLEYKGSYAELKLYTPNPMGCKKITIENNNIEIGDFI